MIVERRRRKKDRSDKEMRNEVGRKGSSKVGESDIGGSAQAQSRMDEEQARTSQISAATNGKPIEFVLRKVIWPHD